MDQVEGEAAHTLKGWDLQGVERREEEVRAEEEGEHVLGYREAHRQGVQAPAWPGGQGGGGARARIHLTESMIRFQ